MDVYDGGWVRGAEEGNNWNKKQRVMDFQQQIVLLDTQCSPIPRTYRCNCLHAPNKRNDNTWSYCKPGHAPPNACFLCLQAILTVLDLSPCSLVSVLYAWKSYLCKGERLYT